MLLRRRVRTGLVGSLVRGLARALTFVPIDEEAEESEFSLDFTDPDNIFYASSF